MSPSEIMERIKERPFTGLRVYVSDGEMYEVRHPELMLVTQRIVHIAQPPFKDKVPTVSVYIDPLHITRIIPINGSSKNGHRQPRKRK